MWLIIGLIVFAACVWLYWWRMDAYNDHMHELVEDLKRFDCFNCEGRGFLEDANFVPSTCSICEGTGLVLR